MRRELLWTGILTGLCGAVALSGCAEGQATGGAWSDDQLFAPLMPYTELLNYGGGQSDYFSAEFEERVQTITTDKVVPLKDDPNLVGWFLDNELKWGKDWRNGNTMLDEYMMLAEGSPGREMASACRPRCRRLQRPTSTSSASTSTRPRKGCSRRSTGAGDPWFPSRTGSNRTTLSCSLSRPRT